jgi:hypothetical protein
MFSRCYGLEELVTMEITEGPSLDTKSVYVLHDGKNVMACAGAGD